MLGVGSLEARAMTKVEFLELIPYSIDHATWGYGKLEVIVQQRDHKGVCYRHPNKLASCGTYGRTWQKVYGKLMPYLLEKGHVKSPRVAQH